MTVPRGKIEASLAERGRPAMWANEQESAVLSGLSPRRFGEIIAELESRGFPQKNPDNGLRPIPAILAFWKLPANLSGLPAAILEPERSERDLENWNGQEGLPRERVAS